MVGEEVEAKKDGGKVCRKEHMEKVRNGVVVVRA